MNLFEIGIAIIHFILESRRRFRWPFRFVDCTAGVADVDVGSKLRIGEHNVVAKQTRGQSQDRWRSQQDQSVFDRIKVVRNSTDYSRRSHDRGGAKEIEESAVQSFLTTGHFLLG